MKVFCVIHRAPKPRAADGKYSKFHNQVGVPIVRIGCREFKCIGDKPPKIIHTSTSIWAMPVRSAAPIALRYSVSIRAWVHTKLIRQIVLTVTWTELPSCSASGRPSANWIGTKRKSA